MLTDKATREETRIYRGLRLYERARGILDHPDLDDLKAELVERAQGIEGIR